MPTPPGQAVFQLRISLGDVVPEVWRRLLVPGGIRLSKLHDIFQIAMGWNDSHLHSFTIGDELYGMHADDYPEDEIDEHEVIVLSALGEHERFVYEYDFGDGWEHEIVVEDVVTIRRGLKFAVCLDGENACPPDDCGGPYGYTEMLAVLADPDHDEHEQMAEWVGGPFDPAFFDLVGVNVALQQLR